MTQESGIVGKVLVEVVCGDKNQCAINTYMVEVAAALPEEVRQFVEYREWTVKNAEGRARFRALGGRKIPTLAINGERCFESIIPSVEELTAAIRARQR